MKKIFIIVILFLTFESKGQVTNGYYEHYSNDTLVERLVIDHDSIFKHYIFGNGKRYFGKGIMKIENNNLNFIYQNIPVSRFYRCRVDFGTNADSLKTINVKVDKLLFGGDFPLCKNKLIDGNKDTILFTDKVSFKKGTKFKNVQIIMNCGGINKSVNLGSNFDNAEITLELDNKTNEEILPQIITFKINSIEKNKFVLLDKSNEILIYKKNRKGEREFNSYMINANKIEIEF